MVLVLGGEGAATGAGVCDCCGGCWGGALAPAGAAAGAAILLSLLAPTDDDDDEGLSLRMIACRVRIVLVCVAVWSSCGGRLPLQLALRRRRGLG